MSDELFIEMDRKDLVELKELYKKHKDGGAFWFKGHQVLPSYAKYLIQYLEEKLS